MDECSRKLCGLEGIVQRDSAKTTEETIPYQ